MQISAWRIRQPERTTCRLNQQKNQRNNFRNPQANHKDCLMRLSEIVHSETDTALVISAANVLAPYMHSKRGTTPSPRYVEESITLPHPEPQTIEQANANIAYLSVQKVQGLISVDSADSIIGDNQKFVDNLIAEEELKLKILSAQGGPREQTIHIEGGLPPLPGTDIIMPLSNGNMVNGHMINGQGSELPAPQNDSVIPPTSEGHEP
jgi:hypothetical protein